jgi:hypothetical protein
LATTHRPLAFAAPAGAGESADEIPAAAIAAATNTRRRT